MHSTECHTNHRLVCCKLRLYFKPKPRKGGPPKKKLYLNKLQSAEVKADFQVSLQSKLENSDCSENPSPETLWDQLKSAILQTSEEVLGFTTKKNKDLFNENNQEIQELLAKRDHPTKPTWLSRHVLWRGLPSISFAISYSVSFDRSKLSGELIWQRELSNIQT